MQNAKDTMYAVMRARLAAVNPDRTVVMNGVTRPAILVAENEVASAALPTGCFVVRWTGESVDTRGAMPLVTIAGEVSYAVEGTAGFAGVDRGRMLAAMDAELAAVLNAAPQTAVKTDSSGLEFGQAVVMMGTSIWWSDVSFGAVTAKNGRLERTATFALMAYGEAGER